MLNGDEIPRLTMERRRIEEWVAWDFAGIEIYCAIVLWDPFFSNFRSIFSLLSLNQSLSPPSPIIPPSRCVHVRLI